MISAAPLTWFVDVSLTRKYEYEMPETLDFLRVVILMSTKNVNEG